MTWVPERTASSRTASERLRPPSILAAGVLVSLLICGGLLAYGSGRGADLTDEIFYLVWARDPDAYALIYQPFGYVLHPLFTLVGGDLRAFRLAGFGVAAAAGAVLGSSLSPVARTRALFSAYGSAAALTMFFPWIITPSYNSAANVGALLIIAGILNIRADRPAAGAAAAAPGLCLAAFAKPPLFAIAVAVVAVAAIARRRGRATPTLAVVLASTAVLMSLFLAPTRMPALVARMLVSQHVLALPNTPLGLPGKIARDWAQVPPSLTGAAVAAGLSLAFRRRPWTAWLGYAAVALSLFHLGSVAGDAVDGALPDFIGLALVTMTAGYAGVLTIGRGSDPLAIGLLLGAPVAVALGTFNNQWAQLNFSMCFPFLGLFALASIDGVRWRKRAAYALSVAGPPGVMLLAAWYPYSLPASVFDQRIPVRHPVARGSILVDPETAAFVRSGRGLAPGALLVDLSGTGPGVAAVLGARAPVLPWLNPATATWPDVVWSRLRPDQRVEAWFVGPVLPLFRGSAPARWFAARQTAFCRTTLAPMTFWGERRSLEVWRPCAGSHGAESAAGRAA